ncbi:PQQ-dependent sugar dehydrogenase [Erythrobacteraceae bacterium CFH 75059]|uniref:PQQ-dependent sugar dehydrogenase n=1 Tax=Qipengyuania thermophila TaxID=2509361 RepID=UPI0010226189|nr:PQQ-dependent sugar dehydrogenase [Qipengyuania thermophila]TCD05362.1 PQQ-dependent sugar dehydrogenase [Erythrobacteraceae bacterium CFH 75059]
MKTLLVTAAAALLAVPVAAQSDSPPSQPLPERSTVRTEAGTLQMQVIARGLEHPWAVALLPDRQALVTERNSGRLLVVNTADGSRRAVSGVPQIFRFKGETGRSQAGLFDVKLHPGFAQNRLVYLSLSAPTERGATLKIVRGRLVDERGSARLEDVTDIFSLQEDDQDSSGLHFGGRMAIHAPTNALFLTVGDRRNISRAQDGEDQAGSILRMTLDGDVHPDNPHRGEGDINDYIFAMGSRNSQALTLDSRGRLWSVEHGPQRGDRVDLVRSGANLGWPFITGGRDYSDAPIGVGLSHPGMTSPLHVFAETIAPSGAAFYDAAALPAWRGNMLVGGLYNQALVRVVVDGERVAAVHTVPVGRRIRDVQVAPDGSIWMVTEHADGELVRLSAR